MYEKIEGCTPWRDSVAEQLRQGTQRMDTLQRGIEDNTLLTCELKADTAELLSILHTCKSGLKALGWLGAAVKWLGGIAAACVAIYSFIHAFGPPK